MKHSLFEALELYKSLLIKYHKTLDLMSNRALADLDEKIVDSLCYSDTIEKPSSQPSIILDIGSGNGLPGIPMALALPHCHFHLVERRQRRAAFLNIAVSRLKLKNVTLHDDDVKNVQNVQASVVTALALGSLVRMYCLTRHLHGDTVTLLSRKGERFKAEIDALEKVLSADIHGLETLPLAAHGTLVAVTVAGGVACRSSEL